MPAERSCSLSVLAAQVPFNFISFGCCSPTRHLGKIARALHTLSSGQQAHPDHRIQVRGGLLVCKQAEQRATFQARMGHQLLQ